MDMPERSPNNLKKQGGSDGGNSGKDDFYDTKDESVNYE
jgi:hypothetical protein